MRLIATVTRVSQSDVGSTRKRAVRHTKSFHHDASLAEVIDWARCHYWLAQRPGFPRVPLELTVDESCPSPGVSFDGPSPDGSVVKAKHRRMECAPYESNAVKPPKVVKPRG